MMLKRILNSSFLLMIMTSSTLLGQSMYRIGLCPGPASAYHTLAEAVSKITETDEEKAKAKLLASLDQWRLSSGLKRFQVAIHYPDRKVRFWKSSSGEKATLFNESASAAAGRGGLNTEAKPGDNQRCFFQDTTVVLDTLRIRLGDFSPDTRFILTSNQKDYALPLNAERTELLLYAGLLPNSTVGRYLPAKVIVGEEVYPVTFYFLSPDDRAQLVRSLRDWTSSEVPSCAELPDRLVSFLTQNWGGKQCINPALYNSSLRQVAKNLLRTEQITCTP